MTNKDTGGPAFPVFPDTETGHAAAFRGMTMRDYFAAQMLASVFSSQSWLRSDLSSIAGVAYMMADAMLAERGKK